MKDKLKSLMKNKVFIGGIACALVLAIAITVILCLPDKKTDTPPQDTASKTTASEIDIPEIGKTDTGTSSVTNDAQAENTGDAVVDLEAGTPSGSTGGKAENPVAPVTEAPVQQPDNKNDNNNAGGGGIVIGDGDKPSTYNCGCANHHCQDEQAHAWIQNLEVEGCKYCGSHSCPSFYAQDEWGYAAIDVTKCPQYNKTSDPTKYCQTCGRELWSQSNPQGCFRYLQDTVCECGETVPGNTCHHH